MEWLRRLWYLLNRRRIDAALRAEMDAHRAAMAGSARFGNARRLLEEAHDAWGFRPLDDAVRDLQIAGRSLRRTPGYTIVAGASLAGVIAVVSAALAVADAYVLRPLPYSAADRLYHVKYAPPGPWEPAGLEAIDWRGLDAVVEHAMAARNETMFVADNGYAGPSRGLRVNLGFLEGLGVRAVHGRALDAADFAATELTPAMIGGRLWQERFGRDPSAVGRDFVAELDSQGRAPSRFRVVGILPEGFWYGSDSRDLVDVLVPLPGLARVYRIRLREGVPAADAAARITEAVRAVATDLPPSWPGVALESAHERYIAPIQPVLRGIGAVVMVILAIACANLAGLTVLRVLRRQRELDIRVALGANRLRLARMLVAESAVLVFVSCAIGLWLGTLALDALDARIAAQLGRPAPDGPDALRAGVRVAGFVAAIGVIVSAVLPMLALVAPRRNPIASLGGGGRTSTDTRRARQWRGALVAAQIAGALALLAGAGLMLRSLHGMVRADYGIRPQNLVRVSVDFSGRSEADEPALVLRRYDAAVARISALTGSAVPLFQWPQFSETPKQPVETDGSGALEIGVVPVNAAYFDVLGIRRLRGRPFTDADLPGSGPVAIVSETAARRLWPGADALGRRILLAERHISGIRARRWHTVVGVVADVRQGFDDRDPADVYTPFRQAPPARYAWLYVASDRPAAVWEPALREAILDVDAHALVRVAVPLVEEAARQWAAPQMLAGLAAGLAAFALLFAALGIYGVTAFALQQRAREIAIRSALGATIGRLTGTLLGESGRILTGGLAAGLIAAAAAGRFLRSQLHGVQPFDPGTVAAAFVLVGVASLAAAVVPVLRAARRSPARELADG